MVKGIAVILGVAIVVITIIVLMQGGLSKQNMTAFGLLGVLSAMVIAVPIFVLGVLVAAQGQILKATLDTAVHGSPFLEKEEMAKVMSL